MVPIYRALAPRLRYTAFVAGTSDPALQWRGTAAAVQSITQKAGEGAWGWLVHGEMT
jgi:hypothetical protein